jgi:hypothetical protein
MRAARTHAHNNNMELGPVPAWRSTGIRASRAPREQARRVAQEVIETYDAYSARVSDLAVAQQGAHGGAADGAGGTQQHDTHR